MTSDCQRLIEYLSGNHSIPANLQAHAQACVSCQTLLTRWRELQTRRTVLPPGDPALVQRIVRAARPFLGSSTVPPATPWFSLARFREWLPSSWPSRLWLATTGAVLGFLALAIVGTQLERFAQHGSPQPSSGLLWAEPGRQAVWLPFGQIASSPVTGQATYANGVTIQAWQANRLSLEAHRCMVHEGQVRVIIPRPGIPYHVGTPHGEVQVTGTEFMVNIRRDHTHIQVSRGTVLLFPARGSPLSLSAPHAARLTAQEAAVIRADIEAPPASGAYAPALDQDVEGGSP